MTGGPQLEPIDSWSPLLFTNAHLIYRITREGFTLLQFASLFAARPRQMNKPLITMTPSATLDSDITA